MGEPAVLLRSEHGLERRRCAASSCCGALLRRTRLYAGSGRNQQVATALQPLKPTRDGYQKRMISIALTTVPHTAAAAAAIKTSAARKPQQMSRPSSSM